MVKKIKTIIAGMLALTLLGAPIVANAAVASTSEDIHFHIYKYEKYWYTAQEGSYAHQYPTGYNPYTGETSYEICTVMQEIEFYWLACECGAKDGSYLRYIVDCHSSCSAGEVKRSYP